MHEREELRSVITWDRDEFRAAFYEMVDLPGRDLSLLVPLPAILTPSCSGSDEW
ncbi:MAG TPA: hypothetical protein VF160_11665 [Candidatus Dormibacteraeota bacterium]